MRGGVKCHHSACGAADSDRSRPTVLGRLTGRPHPASQRLRSDRSRPTVLGRLTGRPHLASQRRRSGSKE